MHINQLRESKFLKKEDCGQGILVTIDHVNQHNVSQSGAPEELKWCLNFKEDILPMVINSTNAQLIAQITKSEDTDGWGGHKLVLYNDPSVSYAGKITGGIRVRAPRNQPAPAKAPAARAQAQRQPDPEPQPSAPPENWQPSDNDGGDPVPF